MKLEIGTVFHNAKLSKNGRNVWSEITAICNDMVTLSLYGKEVKARDVVFTKKEVKYMIRKQIIFQA